MSATKAAVLAAAITYVVARGVVVTMDPKSKKTVELGEGKPFTPADEDEAASLLKSGAIMLAGDYAAKVGGSSVTATLDAAKAEAATATAAAASEKDRADKLQAELDKLKAAAPSAQT